MIQETVTGITGWIALNQEDNLFVLGMDSLRAILLARGLRQAFASSDIAISTVYSNPSVSFLARKIKDPFILGQQSESAHRRERQRAIESMIEEHRLLIDEIKSKLPTERTTVITPEGRASKPASNSYTVVLTGSTGHLGSYLLQALVESPDIAHIYCLDRAVGQNCGRAQTKVDGRLQKSRNTCRVSQLTVDLAYERFGLEEETYHRLLQQTATIIHNAWPVNFYLPPSAFKPQITGVVQMVHFAASAAQHPALFFISSISFVLDYAGDCSTIPESIIMDVSAPSQTGYAESEFIAETLLDHASKRLDIDARVARFGQIAGPVRSQGHLEYPGVAPQTCSKLAPRGCCSKFIWSKP